MNRGCADVSRAIRWWRRELAALLVDSCVVTGASFGASSQAARREGIRSLRGNWGDTRATRGQFWGAFGRGDGVRGAATGRGARSGLGATRGGRAPRASEHAIQSAARWRRWVRRDDAARAPPVLFSENHPAMLLGEGIDDAPGPKKRKTTNRAPRRRPHSRPPKSHACPARPFRRAGSPRPGRETRCRSTAATAGFSAGRRGCRRAPR